MEGNGEVVFVNLNFDGSGDWEVVDVLLLFEMEGDFGGWVFVGWMILLLFLCYGDELL